MHFFNFQATGIGSVPFKDPAESCRTVFDNFKQIPFWPQLPKRSFLENMYVQFSEKLPGLVVDEPARSLHIDTSLVAAQIEEVYGKYLDSDLEFFRISENHAAGLYKFLELAGKEAAGAKFLKGHVTGPISYALFLTDQNKKSAIYDRDLFEVITKVLCMKARWQVRKLKRVFPSVIIFMDEPYLVSLGSSYINVNMPAAFERLDELAGAIRQEGALAGLHCCGNTDWGLILKRKIDIINFDAYNFCKEFFLYAPDVINFLAAGGTIAWGVVPSSDTVRDLSTKALAEGLKSMLASLASKGIGRDRISSMVTSSCGAGSLEDETARKVLETVRRVSEEMQKKG